MRAGVAFRRRPRDRHRVAHHRQHAREADVLGEDPDAEGADELQDDGRRHVAARVRSAAERANRAPDRPPRCRPPRAGTSAPPRRRRSRRPRPRRRRGGRSAARWRRSAGSRPRGWSGGDAADAAAAARRSPRRRRAARRRRRARWPRPTACRAPARARPRRPRSVVRPTRNDDQAGDRRPVVAEISRRRVEGRVEQDGRDEQRQRELRRHA